MKPIIFFNKIKSEIEKIDSKQVEGSLKLFKNVKKKKSKVIIVGNGGNSSSCSHVSNDLTNYSKNFFPKKDKDSQPIKVIIINAITISTPGILKGR